ncbi:EI24 domain-containing protein [Acrocarpospora catenulata]|uniref:EI24 domain-containing protein n=1 Tax=Acrocarpospora catenulata TaxID=2836182 RepID=UPI001BD94BA2|nr:EI24 domain-containing protein [Acrocarpospora catenulata]
MSGIGRPVRQGVGGFFEGVGFFFKGLGWTARYPRWWLFGLIPALIAFVLYVVALIWLGTNAGDIAAWMTPFADDWSWQGLFRTLIGIVIFVAGLVLSVVTFAAVTLAIGGPFYDKLSEKVEESMGGVPNDDTPFWQALFRSIRDSIVTLILVLMFTIPLFILGFVPVIGQTVVPVLGAAVSGFFLTVELTALAMERRRIQRKARFAILRANKGLALGFGVAVFLTFLIPFAAVLTMPGAVAGAALLVRVRLTPEVR